MSAKIYRIRPTRGRVWIIRTEDLAADLRRDLARYRITGPVRIEPVLRVVK